MSAVLTGWGVLLPDGSLTPCVEPTEEKAQEYAVRYYYDIYAPRRSAWVLLSNKGFICVPVTLTETPK